MADNVGNARGARSRRCDGAAVGAKLEAGDLDGEEDGEGRLDDGESLGSLGAILRQHFELLSTEARAAWRSMAIAPDDPQALARC
jgi:hypothetical protein